jgi:peptidoglycan-associated lipoprotein
MKSRQVRYLGIPMLLLLVFTGACRKPAPPPPPPPPPPAPAPAPSVSLTVEPANIQRGQSATLRWSSQNATDLELQPGIGRVDPQGTRSVSPTDSTTYTLRGTGPGGSNEATARLTVTVPPPPPAPPPPPRPPEVSMREKYNQAVTDAYFDFDKSDIRDDARSALTRDAEFLRANPNITVQIEGHCDERGSEAYNLGLGDRRSNSARDFLVSLGINGDRVTTISYGKERPFCTESTEECWQQNRRGHLVCTNCGQ